MHPQVGEHQGCGPGNMPTSGFSYLPESFMAARIGFYNFGWVDMGVPDLDRMMDIVQVCPWALGMDMEEESMQHYPAQSRRC